jgi:hypothetical protein
MMLPQTGAELNGPGLKVLNKWGDSAIHSALSLQQSRQADNPRLQRLAPIRLLKLMYVLRRFKAVCQKLLLDPTQAITQLADNQRDTAISRMVDTLVVPLLPDAGDIPQAERNNFYQQELLDMLE